MKGIGSGYYDAAAIGDFTEAAARQFFQQEENVPSITDEDWSKVYKVLLLVCYCLALPLCN
jgi:hypothetical protein